MNKEMVKATGANMQRYAALAEPTLKHYGLTPELFSRVALTALLNNPRIAECSEISLKKAMLACAEKGLMPDGEQAALVPHGKDATLIVMVGGKLDLARRAIKGISFEYGCVYDDEVNQPGGFEHVKGSEPTMIHRPLAKASMGWDNIHAAYAVAFIPGNDRQECVVLYKRDLERARSFAKTKAIWNKHPEEMCIKTALHRLCKRLPVRGNGHLFDDVVPVDIEEAPKEEAKPQPEALPVKPPAPKRKKAAPKPPPPPEPEPEPEPEEAEFEDAPPLIEQNLEDAVSDAGF